MTDSPIEAPIKSWWVQPGKMYDKKGVPIYPGDLIRTPHFIGARRKQWYIYHTAVFINGYMELIPTCHLQPDKAERGGGRCMMSYDIIRNSEVIAGYGPDKYLNYTDRPKGENL